MRDEADEGRDHELRGDRLRVVQQAKRLDARGLEADLFVGLAQRGRQVVGVLGIDAAARERDLARVMAHAVGALGEHQAGLAAIDDRHEYRRAYEGTGRHHAAPSPLEPCASHRDQVVNGHL